MASKWIGWAYGRDAALRICRSTHPAHPGELVAQIHWATMETGRHYGETGRESAGYDDPHGDLAGSLSCWCPCSGRGAHAQRQVRAATVEDLAEALRPMLKRANLAQLTAEQVSALRTHLQRGA